MVLFKNILIDFREKKESVTGFGLEVKNDNNIFEQQARCGVIWKKLITLFNYLTNLGFINL